MYKIFTSEEGDWVVAAVLHGKTPVVLYEGHSTDRAYSAILEDADINIDDENEREMATGTYKPVLSDWD